MCDSCQDCDNITLPTGSGPTGATGADGNDGADGSNGTAVLYNDLVSSSLTSTSLSLFTDTKAYTLPAGTLSTDGSKLKITYLATPTGHDLKSIATCYFYIAGSNFTSKSAPFTISNFDGNPLLTVEITMNRVSATSMYIHCQTTLSDAFRSGTFLAGAIFTETVTVSDIDANNLLLELRGTSASSPGTPTLTSSQFTVEHYIK